MLQVLLASGTKKGTCCFFQKAILNYGSIVAHDSNDAPVSYMKQGGWTGSAQAAGQRLPAGAGHRATRFWLRGWVMAPGYLDLPGCHSLVILNPPISDLRDGVQEQRHAVRESGRLKGLDCDLRVWKIPLLLVGQPY